MSFANFSFAQLDCSAGISFGSTVQKADFIATYDSACHKPTSGSCSQNTTTGQVCNAIQDRTCSSYRR